MKVSTLPQLKRIQANRCNRSWAQRSSSWDDYLHWQPAMTVCCFPKAIILLTVTAVAVPGETTSLVARCSNMALSVNMKIQLERSLTAVNKLAQSFLLWSMWLCLEWLCWSKCSCMTVHLGKIRLWQDNMQEKKKTKLSSKVIVLVMIWESKKSQTEVHRLMLFTFHGLLRFW